jgi:hypothetical protein
MADFLGLGITHYPLLAVTDEHMADGPRPQDTARTA